jgi:predicted phage terminase large subunit-like protein
VDVATINFWQFFKLFVKMQKISLPVKAFHKEVCVTLQRAVCGELAEPYVVINIMPRVGKSKILEALACWVLGYAPDSQNIYTSFSEDLVTDRVRYIQEVMRSAWYQEIFPEVRLGSVQKATEFNTVQGGLVYGAGSGGTITGKGAGLKRVLGGFIAVDDPSNPNAALSKVESEAVRFWFENVLKWRRNSDRWCPIIVVMQRLAVDDLTGYLLEAYPGKVKLLKFPARVNGESIVPETLSTEGMNMAEKTNPFTFWAQLMQEPVVFGGNLIKTDDFVMEVIEAAQKWDRKIITGDTGMKAKEHNDFSVFQCWGKRGAHAYLIDQIRGKWESPELLTMAEGFWRKHRAGLSRFYIEDKASGTGLIQQLKGKGIAVTPIERSRDKVSRVHDILPYIATHCVHIKEGQPWTVAFLSECAQFRADGLQKHDDQVDPLCDALEMLLGHRMTVWDALGIKAKRFG